MQLAVKEAAGVWRLADGWKGFLVRRGEDLDAANRLRALIGEELPCIGFFACDRCCGKFKGSTLPVRTVPFRPKPLKAESP